VTASDTLLPYSSAIEAVLYLYAAGALIAYMLADHEITRDELFAVGATFTLVAWAFAYAFTVCQAVEPGSFTAAVDPTGERSWMELLFLSFTTLTSTGLSDVVPVEPFARSMVMIEQLAGLGYVAMVVSRLVGLTVITLLVCGGVIWWARRATRKRMLAANTAGRLVLEGRLPLDARSAIHLIRVDGHPVVVTTDATGLKSIVPVQPTFDAALDAAEPEPPAETATPEPAPAEPVPQ